MLHLQAPPEVPLASSEPDEFAELGFAGGTPQIELHWGVRGHYTDLDSMAHIGLGAAICFSRVSRSIAGADSGTRFPTKSAPCTSVAQEVARKNDIKPPRKLRS